MYIYYPTQCKILEFVDVLTQRPLLPDVSGYNSKHIRNEEVFLLIETGFEWALLIVDNALIFHNVFS